MKTKLAQGNFYNNSDYSIVYKSIYVSIPTHWHNFYEFHKLAIDELEAFDYEEYKANGFKLNHLGDYDLKLERKPE